MRIGIIDTGVNPWHSHVRGVVEGCRLWADGSGVVQEDADFADPVGHGTAVAGILRQGLPDAELFAVRVFDASLTTYPSLVARGILRAAAAGCDVVNLSLGVLPGPGAPLVVEACAAAQEAGCVLVAAARPEQPGLLPAAVLGVVRATVDDSLEWGAVLAPADPSGAWRAPGRPRDLQGLPRGANLWGASFACARVAVHLGQRLAAVQTAGDWRLAGYKGLDRPWACRYKDPLTGD